MTSEIVSALDHIAIGDSAFRYVLDSEHRDWTVRELDLDGSGQPAKPVLVFISEGDIRQVQRFPIDWRRLDDLSLLALGEQGDKVADGTRRSSPGMRAIES